MFHWYTLDGRHYRQTARHSASIENFIRLILGYTWQFYINHSRCRCCSVVTGTEFNNETWRHL